MTGLYVAISGHGFGHTTRTCSIVAAVQHFLPDLPVTIVTTSPQWLIDSYVTQPYHYRPVRLDVGVVQRDGLQMDKTATLAKLKELLTQQQELVAQEAAYIQSQGINLVFADIPPLAIAIARSVGIPCWLSSNFGWDLIYQDWVAELPDFQEIVEWIQDLYRQVDLLLRQPFCEAMPVFRNRIDVGLTGGTPKFSPAEIYEKLQLSPDRLAVLISFGGLGLQAIPYDNVMNYPDLQFITFDQAAPNLANLLVLAGRNIRPVDIMPICDVVITKPGYSTIAEACRLQRGIVCLTRSDFAEGKYLLAGVRNYMRHHIIEPEDFYHGKWEFLCSHFTPPRLTDPPAGGGEWTIAQKIVTYFCGGVTNWI
ncbi:MAG: glycosyl transferase [Pseudanabaenaceae cyanobacterium SKYGB_i_bin29]|nr:glycosyl transferase [Pseudanabaenaceae cyanobacterium SKYG29]MDW8420567.1 glycosyl transferase [Pseudanabaenaceae cyanobacterium SKYGB_i_bin29]